MKQLIQARVGMTAIIAGIVGAMFGVGGVENSVTTEQLIASVGVAVTSLMLMYAGVQLIKAAE
jgi:high-affinity Fe2+/Pb2+ permease